MLVSTEHSLGWYIRNHRLSATAHTNSSSTLRGQGRRIAWAQEFETRLDNIVRNCLYKKKKGIISQVWWFAPVVLTTGEAETGGSLEPRSLRLQRPMIMPLPSNVGDTARPCLKKKKRKEIVKGVVSELKTWGTRIQVTRTGRRHLTTNPSVLYLF